jgi:Kef-type K+ transport system membrane component KefB
LIIGISALLTILARLIKQPPIIAYLIAGILVGPLFFNIVTGSDTNIIQMFAHIGVALLLFIVGLSLDLRLLKEVGTVSVLAGISQIIITGIIGFIFTYWLGFSFITSFYISAALVFSSTVVVVKILSDKKEIDTLHGRIALGILIVQDFVAAIALLAIPIINSNKAFVSIFQQLGMVSALIVVIFLFSLFVMNKFLNYLARSQEALFLFGIAWALILAVLFEKLGFSLEIGALIAGMSLASSKYHLDLSGKLKPLRDFFIVLFFVFFGSQLVGPITPNLIRLAVIFSFFIILAKPLIVMAILKLFGYKKRTNFLASSSLAQISEFSLIIVLLGFTLGHLSQEIMSLTVLIAIITIAVSSYGIHYAHLIFEKISGFLNIFEGNKFEKAKSKESYSIVLFGYHRIGYKIINHLQKLKASFAVVDYNPKVILSLGKQGINCIYGDASDKEFLREIDLSKAKLIISTIPDENSNLCIKEYLEEIKSEAIFIATAEQPRYALDLYEQGIDYVILPHHLGGDYAAEMIKNYHLNKEMYKEAGKKHKKELNNARNNSTFNE